MHTQLSQRREGAQRARTATVRPCAPRPRVTLRAQQTEQQAEARTQPAATFPVSYDQAMRQAQEAAKAAVAAGAPLVEVEFPSTTLTGVSGDGEGQNEMNASMGFLRQFLGGFRSRAASTRVFFPDNVELDVARSGQTEDPSAGRKALDPVFGDDTFPMGYLTKQNAAWAVLGFYKSSFSPSDLVKDTDDMLVVAYPSFNPREELSAVYELYEKKAKARSMPIILFNAELDRLRGGYYPSVFFPEIAKFGKDLLPLTTTAYYIHNFKGTRPATLFRCYPGPWQLLKRDPLNENDPGQVLWESDKMPTLKEVALEILPAVWR
ncbi:hypothetical protein HYH03_001936 [Edaphochlamys debaryana]|uniref:DUF1995 domain-containing protein n=1 Tax=Edaphochlamys debaryana TaxID=47281 RepID=A0A835YES8_9CHLO|nr:hypothetical protein HYH03_001936 [Edaphochlamys debaryana]|eukprot:KAG2500362.1 hypothetical protein HYH03_001936 [Edaphochlamys debaryana]